MVARQPFRQMLRSLPACSRDHSHGSRDLTRSVGVITKGALRQRHRQNHGESAEGGIGQDRDVLCGEKGDMPAEEEDETNVEGQTAVSSSDQDVFSSLILGVSESASASVDPTMAEEYKQGRAVSLSSPPEVSKSVSRSRQMGCTARRLLYIPRLLKTKGRRVLGMESGPVPPAMARSPARPQFIASFY